MHFTPATLKKYLSAHSTQIVLRGRLSYSLVNLVTHQSVPLCAPNALSTITEQKINDAIEQLSVDIKAVQGEYDRLRAELDEVKLRCALAIKKNHFTELSNHADLAETYLGRLNDIDSVINRYNDKAA